MAYVAFLKILDPELNRSIRAEHLRYVGERRREGKVLMAGPFTSGWGGMVIYHNVSEDEARTLAQADPAVASRARELTLSEWTILDLDG